MLTAGHFVARTTASLPAPPERLWRLLTFLNLLHLPEPLQTQLLEVRLNLRGDLGTDVLGNAEGGAVGRRRAVGRNRKKSSSDYFQRCRRCGRFYCRNCFGESTSRPALKGNLAIRDRHPDTRSPARYTCRRDSPLPAGHTESSLAVCRIRIYSRREGPILGTTPRKAGYFQTGPMAGLEPALF